MSVVDDIKGRLDIVDVISAYVPLKKAGRNFKGLCPFHAEKTPSFVVFPDNQSWHCFGSCGIGGDFFSFIMKKEKLDFGEALQVLAQRAGVELTAHGEEISPEEQNRERVRQVLQTAHPAANQLQGADRFIVPALQGRGRRAGWQNNAPIQMRLGGGPVVAHEF